MHYWRSGDLIENREWLKTNLITGDHVFTTMRRLRDWVDATPGLEKIKLALPTGTDRAAAVSITDLMSPHRVTDFDVLERCVKAIDLNDERLADYDTWCALLRAICAACGGDMPFFTETVLPWLRTNTSNLDNDGNSRMEDKWKSFTDSQLGAEYVYQWASQFNCMDGLHAMAQQIFDAADAAQNALGSMNQMAIGNGMTMTGGSPTPSQYTDEAISDRFTAENPDWRHLEGEGWLKRESGVYVPAGHRVLDPVGRLCSAIGDPFRSQGPGQALIDVMLKSTRKAENVERKLRHHPAMVVRPEDFDADPWLVNTPGGVIDLREGSLTPHANELMREQTAVTPDLFQWGNYGVACPRFMEALAFMADGDETVIPLLQRWGGYALVGKLLDQCFLFIQGKSGTAKSAFSDILIRLMGSYGTPGSTTLFMKQSDKRSFELGDIAGKRGLFVPETKKGMTWDEILICEMLGGTEIRAERKYQRSFTFRSIATITVTGNHVPAFVTNTGPNDSGIDRCMLLLRINKLLEGNLKIDTEFSEKLVAAEGSAIMTFFVQGALEGWQSLQQTGRFLGDTARSAEAEAKKARRGSSPHLNWISERMVLERGARVNAHDAFRSFRQFVVEDNPHYRESKAEFRDALSAFTNGAVTYDRSGNERVYIGMRFAESVTSSTVVSLFQYRGLGMETLNEVNRLTFAAHERMREKTAQWVRRRRQRKAAKAAGAEGHLALRSASSAA